MKHQRLSLFVRTWYAAAYTCVMILLSAVSVQAQNTAAFTADNFTGCGTAYVQFINQSTSGASASWDFGDGGAKSTLWNPTRSFTKPGTYTVTLTVTFTNGTTGTATHTVNVYKKPTAQFTTDVTSGCTPLPVKFTDQSTAGDGTISSVNWDFGDGNGGTGTTANYTYTIGGDYAASAIVTNSYGCTNSNSQIIHAKATPIPAFTSNTQGSCKAPLTVNFTNGTTINTTGNPGITYLWDFGDGSTSTDLNPIHTYTAEGNYTVTLTATSADGCSKTLTQTEYIKIAAIAADFTISESLCKGTTLHFVNTTQPAPQSATWTFSDGDVQNSVDAVKTFGAAGTYSVTLQALTQDGCQANVTRSFTISDIPTASIGVTPTTACTVPATFNFTGLTTGATAWKWNFNDGGSSAVQNVSHQYNAEGTYTVTLTASNAAGCAANAVTTVAVKKPILSIDGLPNGCVPLEDKFTPIVATADPVISWSWNFGDGTTSTDKVPTHIFTKAGNYIVTLTITTQGGCMQTATFPVQVGDPVDVEFTVDRTTGCQPTVFQFTNQSNPRGTSWEWTFEETNGNGSSTLENPTYVWSTIGTHTVILTVINNGCRQTLTKTDLITINPPAAAFTVNTPDCSNLFQRSFTDKSDFGASTTKIWNWDFGDSQTSNVQNPTHVYAAGGTYTVTLTVDNGSCQSVFKTTITIVNESPKIYANPTTLCKNGSVTFSMDPMIANHFSSFQWKFGDGATSTTGAQGPATHEYNAPGDYVASMVATDVFGCLHPSNSIPITVNGANAKFSIETKQCKGIAITFTDQSTTKTGNTIVSWTWDYGDGSTPEVFTTATPTVTHTYTSINNYPVTLTVKDNTGCEDSYTATARVANIIAAFGGPDSIACLNTPYQFSNSSITTPLTYQWNFGDGTTSTDATPAHTYTAPGKYTVSLMIEGTTGCRDTITTVDYLRVPNPIADFSYPAVAADVCPPVKIQFTNLSSDYVSSAWTFGDVSSSTEQDPLHNYIKAGTFGITLTVYSQGGCASAVAGPKNILIDGPNGSYTVTPETGCYPLAVTMNAVSSAAIKYIWDFGDGHSATTTTPTSPTYTYPQEGVYYPVVLLEDARGCRVAADGSSKVIADKVKANFGTDVTQACDGGTVLFSDSSYSVSAELGMDMTYAWDFGVTTKTDDVSSAHTPSYVYDAPGTYNVTLTTTTIYGCVNTIQKAIVVEPKPVAVIDPAGPLCTGATLQLAGHETKNIPGTKWSWNILGQDYLVQTPPATTFNQSGDQVITLTISTASGICSSTATETISVVDYPALNPNPVSASICRGGSLVLHANTDANATVTWTDYKINDLHSADPVVTPEIDTTYHVIAQNAAGCAVEKDIPVLVSQPFAVTASDTFICKNDAAQLHAAGAVTYRWSPATGLNNPSAQNPMASPDTTTTYTVTGYGRDACFTSQAMAVVTVHPLPELNAGPDITLATGSSYQIPVVSSNDVTKIEWWPVNYLDCVDCLKPTATPKTTTTYTVTATNAYNCKSVDEITIKMVCESGNTWLPNTFTPNNDGQNDIFYIRGRGIKTIKSWRIYNRWGQLVFERTNFSVEDPTSGWDGKVKGVPVNPDVFVYVAEVVCDTNEDFTLKGNVMLLR
ncbi:PKD domain-containing protein [Chitinophaga sancti]|uniref:Gliding motility-associated C-terminal domain-containing protein n=1 Tax=Chitinophaga sancti TaxID=1004 RepID=A0A1K1RDW9_9BACT|nr:PKD domain-containing protein [Chitinophaga sancti]WQD65676.1 PKD domain-containing protein [Chitinophaga sancti]WQG88702.1 PKD domain-containing protein [Chitinophaga sancti]SFW70248.1 gliding motility-associated C-terminal domain-containing protein [Chitinophaga sancti]